MEHICYNCFRDSLNEAGICTLCGFDGKKNREKYPLALPLGSILFGRYIIGRVLGQGGFGITYLAQDYQTKGLVAIKEFFPDSMASRTSRTTVTPYSGERGENFGYGLTKFLDEAQTMAEFIGNPNITRVYSYFEENGTGYFVMEYLEGDSFLDYIKAHGGSISWEETMKVVLPVMDALSAMHEKGIIHRDVTPDNIYITRDGTVKLLDFGAARYSLGNVSRSLDVILKHGFAPKEQYSRRGRQGAYTDVYSLGATIYYAITGTKSDDAIERSDEDNLPLPTTLGAKISIAQEDALLKALAVHPADRYQSMAEFRAALIAAQPEQFNPAAKAEQASEQKNDPIFTKKLPRWLIPGLAVLAAAVCLAAFGSRGSAEAPTEPRQAQTLEVTAPAILPEVPEPAPLPEVTEPATIPTKPREIHFMAMMEEIPTSVAYAEKKNQPFWGQKAYSRAQVETVIFQSTQEGAPDNAWDVSAAQNRSVLAWMKDGTLTVAADGLISPNGIGSYLFEYFVNLQTIDFGDCFDTSYVTSMEYMFRNCTSLTNLDVSGFDTSNVTNMRSMFWGCDSLMQLDLSGFDTSNVTDMRYMFYNCKGFTSLDLSGFDTSNVTDMGNMFDCCFHLISIDLSGFNTSNVTDMIAMFGCCYDLSTLDLSSFDTSNVSSMFQMFASCRSLTSLDLSHFDTSNVETMKSMFKDCKALTSLNLSGFRTGDETKLDDIFSGCGSLTDLQCTDSAIVKAYKNRKQ